MTKLGSTLLSSGAFSISSAQPELRIYYDRTGGGPERQAMDYKKAEIYGFENGEQSCPGWVGGPGLVGI